MNKDERDLYERLYKDKITELAHKVIPKHLIKLAIDDAMEFILKAPQAVSGKSYRAAAAGAIYLSILKNNLYIAQRDLVNDADVCEVTIRKVSSALARDSGFQKRRAGLSNAMRDNERLLPTIKVTNAK